MIPGNKLLLSSYLVVLMLITTIIIIGAMRGGTACAVIRARKASGARW